MKSRVPLPVVASAAMLIAACADSAVLIPIAHPQPPSILSASPAPVVGGARYGIIDLGTLGGTGSIATGINDLGQIVGGARTAGGEAHAFVYEDGEMLRIGVPGPLSAAQDINNSGQVVGFSGPATDPRAFVWEGGSIIDLGTLGGSQSLAFRINDSGQIVGFATTAGGERHAVLWEDDVITDLGTLGGPASRARGINDRGQVVGASETAAGALHAFLWENSVMTDLAIGVNSEAIAINDGGQVVGWYESAGGGTRGFLWAAGAMTDLGALDGGSAAARGINDVSHIVGVAHGATGDDRAFLRADGDLADLGSLGGARGWAEAINDAGDVVGFSLLPNGGVRATLWQVQGPAEGIQALREAVADLREAAVLTAPQSAELEAMLDHAVRTIAAGQEPMAIPHLAVFVDQVADLVGNGVVSESDGQILIEVARTISETLG